MTARSRVLSAVALAGAIACAGHAPPVAAPVPEFRPEDVAVSLYLLGDGGAPNPRGEPVLEALKEDLSSRGTRGVVLFLGDNVYPRGLPAPGHPGRPEMERRLAAQVEAVIAAGATAYFVPGNHDWAKSGRDGWAAIRRQAAFIDSAGGGGASLQPRGGCPGPSTVDVGRLRLVMVDTQWWLHGGDRPQENSECGADTEREVVDSLKVALDVPPDRMVVVAAHHPLASGGEHGGYFGWKDHIFPLRTIGRWLWLPLPWLGSLYPAARQNGISSQDIGSPAYQRLIGEFRRAFEQAPPDLYAAGHEHNIQVIADGGAPIEVVSGGGYYGHSGRAVPIRGALFAKEASGFVRVDVPYAGPARLAVVEVDSTAARHDVFSIRVE